MYPSVYLLPLLSLHQIDIPVAVKFTVVTHISICSFPLLQVNQQKIDNKIKLFLILISNPTSP